jgi:hypothetical protein
MRTSLLLSVLAFMAAAPAALIACSGSDKEASTADNDVHSSEPTDPAGAKEGSSCWETKDCEEGLVCKKRPSSAPPPGAMGMPVPSSTSTHSGPPAGAVGMPLPPNTCQTPAPGEEGARCRSADECNDGLTCSFDDGSGSSSSTGGMPPGAMGMPVPSSTSTGHAFPPGAMGMPIIKYGKCAKDDASSSSSGGPPPGTMGMPIHP